MFFNVPKNYFSTFTADALDYTALTTELTFDPDNSRRCVSIGLVDDSLLEPSEEFEVSLTTDEEQVTVDPDRAVVTILDTDGMIGLDSLIIFKIIFFFYYSC